MRMKKEIIAKWPSLNVLAIVLGFFVLADISAAQEDITIEPVGHFGGYPGCAAVQENYAYLCQGTVLSVLGISGAELHKVASLTLPDEPVDIVTDENYAYFFIGNSDSALQIVDISDPQSPSIIGSAEIQGTWRGKLHVSGNYVYVAMGDSLKVVDVSNPTAANVVSTTITSAQDIFVTGDYAYVGGSDSLRIFDITNPTSPNKMGSFSAANVNGVFVQGNHAYVGSDQYPDIGLYIIDISNPQNPSKVGFFETKIVEGLHTHFKSPCEVVIEGDYAYIGCRGSGWLFIADISDPANPTEAGKLEISEGAFPSIESLQVVPPYAYMTTGCSSAGFLLINVMDPANPEIEAKYEDPWDVMHIFARGDTLYLASWERLWIYRFAEPENPIPTLLGSDTTWTELYRIFVKGNYLYGLKESKMHIIDVADPNNMFEVSAYESANGTLREVKVKGNYAHLLVVNDAQSLLEIVDVSNPSNPTKEENEFTLPGEGRDLFVQGESTVAYVAYYANDANQGLQIVDVSDPSSPSGLGSAQTQGKPICIWVADTLAYLGSNTEENWHLEAFNVADALDPINMGGTSGTGMIWDVEVRDSLVVASIPTGSVYFFKTFIEYNQIMWYLMRTCPTPASLCIALIYWSDIWYIFTMGGHGCPDYLSVSASWGIFIQWFYGWLTEVENKTDDLPPPTRFELSQNYPNPFNPVTTIEFSVKKRIHVLLKVYDIRGREVATLANAIYLPGHYQTEFDTKGLASGLYFYHIQMGSFQTVKKMIVQK